MAKLSKFNISFYALNKKGEFGSAALFGLRETDKGRRPNQYAVHDGRENKLRDVAYLYDVPQK